MVTTKLRFSAVLLLVALAMAGCSTRSDERDRNDNTFTVRDSGDWGDAAGRVINHLLAPDVPRGGIWPEQDDR